ncbi:MAG TPA: transglutaminase-like domain-containing protein [Salinimicrobium sp.]|nr:transglutaminase-like domain-containing protein [Salinimicrobium sp.]
MKKVNRLKKNNILMEVYTPLQQSKKSGLLITALLICGISFAQFSPEYHLYKEKYPDADWVRLNQESSVTIEIKRGELEIQQEITEEDLYLNEGATYGSKKSLSYSSFFELGKIEASSFVYKEDEYKELKVKDFSQKDELTNSFHDDVKSVNFVYSNLSKGGKSKLQYDQEIKNPRFLNAFYFGDFSPVIRNKFTIVADKEVQMGFKMFNTEALDIKFTEEEKRGSKIYTWEVLNVEPAESEENTPSYKSFIPHIVPFIKSYKVDGKVVEVSGKIDNLYSWYYSLVKDINQEEPDPGLVKVVEELTAGIENDLEKVRAIYYWTQKNIKYIAFEYALGGFVPREANVVFKNKYGDCKDNSSILMEMLSIAGLKGNLTWIGTRDIPYAYEEVPSPLVDNHMILTYNHNGKIYYLDATGRYLDLEFPSAFIQGKEALIGNGADNFKIEIVPVIPADKNFMIDSTSLRLKGNSLVGESKVEIGGYNKVDLFNYLERQNNKEDLKEFYIFQFEKGNNKFLIDEFEEINKFEYDKNFFLDYNFTIGDYAKKIGDEIYVNLNLNKDISRYKSEEKRVNDLEQEYKHSFQFTSTFEIPEGYEVSYLPEDLEASNEYISAGIDYSLTGGKITYKHFFKLNFLLLNKEQQAEVNAVIEKVEKAFKEIIVLKTIKTTPNETD